MRHALRALGWAGLLSLGLSGILQSQERGSGIARPSITVSASEEVEVAPDRAHLTIAVETRGRTSQAAATENARLANAMLEAVRRAGVAPQQLRTQGLMISPEYQYPKEGGRPTVVGYQARNSVLVEVRDISRVSAVIDAAIGQGATNISGPSFALSNPDSARRVAMDVAVRRAVADAEVMARAAGGKLGAVLELSAVEPDRAVFERGMVMAAMRVEDSVATPIEAGLIKVRASVTLKVAIDP